MAQRRRNGTAERCKVERAWVRRHLDRIRDERTLRRSKLADLKAILEQALGQPAARCTFSGSDGRDDAA